MLAVFTGKQIGGVDNLPGLDLLNVGNESSLKGPVHNQQYHRDDHAEGQQETEQPLVKHSESHGSPLQEQKTRIGPGVSVNGNSVPVKSGHR